MHPDFIGIGAQKAGTTWLYRNLRAHPGIWMPLKETHYFDEKIHEPANVFPRVFQKLTGRRAMDRRWRQQVRTRAKKYLSGASGGSEKFSKESLIRDLRYYAGRPDDDWYASLFEPGRGKVVGEITPSYSTLDPEAVGRVHALAPGAKLIFMMRNPIERAWSQAVMQFSKVEHRDIGDVGEKHLRRTFESEGSLLRTDYLHTIETWSNVYPENQIFVGFLEDVSLFPAKLLESVYDFLGVDASFKAPGANRKIHSRSANQAPAGALKYLAGLYREDAGLLDERFGGYASFWSYCAERLADNALSEESLPYPLWGSSLWNDWLDGAGIGSDRLRVQSGSLSSVRP